MNDGMDCQECGMFVEPAAAFHPVLPLLAPARRASWTRPGFIAQHGFMPNPETWHHLTDSDGWHLHGEQPRRAALRRPPDRGAPSP